MPKEGPVEIDPWAFVQCSMGVCGVIHGLLDIDQRTLGSDSRALGGVSPGLWGVSHGSFTKAYGSPVQAQQIITPTPMTHSSKSQWTSHQTNGEYSNPMPVDDPLC